MGCAGSKPVHEEGPIPVPVKVSTKSKTANAPTKANTELLQLATDIRTATAQAIIDACLAKATAIGVQMDIAVCDAACNLKGFLRMDGAWLGSIDIAQKKARTARYFNMDTRDIGPLCQPGQPLYCIEHSNQGLITFGGGIVLKSADGVIIGAVGVSGGSVEQDHEVAAAGIAAAKKQ